MLSIVIPFYKKLNEFKFSLENYNYKHFIDNDVQLVIVVDDPYQSDELVEYLSGVNLRMKVLLNRTPHEWRNPAKPLNVGIKHSDGEKILVMSPESCFWNTTALKHLIHGCTEHSFAIGDIKFCTYEERNFILLKHRPEEFYDRIYSQIIEFGSICYMRTHVIQIGGYDESRPTWGGEDMNLRVRLSRSGVNRNKVDANLIHFQELPRSVTAKKIKQDTTLNTPEYFTWRDFPDYLVANNGVFGNDFDEIILEK